MSKSRNMLLVGIAFFVMISGCAGTQTTGQTAEKVKKDVASYEEAGKYWGKTLYSLPGGPWKPGITELYSPFISALIWNLDYFNVHAELKEAFKKGFRLGYEERIADLVLGPHVTEAAGWIGKASSEKFVKVINTFEEGWAKTLREAVEVFIVLISEGSQADREIFVQQFMQIYSDKWAKSQEILKSKSFMKQISEGGTVLYIDYSKGKTLAALEIPPPDNLKAEIYHQTFYVMGDEWGRRYSTNLIKRDDLVETLRKCRPALVEVSGNNLGIIYGAFLNSYGTDAENVFKSLLREAEYSEVPSPATPAQPTKESTAGQKSKK